MLNDKRPFTPQGNIVGAATLALLITLTHLLFPAHKGELAAAVLVAIATVYPAILLAQRVRLRDALLESAAAVITMMFALLGLVFAPWLVGVGLLVHAVWDWIKHRTGVGVKVVAWYPPMCAIVDSLAALYVFWIISL